MDTFTTTNINKLLRLANELDIDLSFDQDEENEVQYIGSKGRLTLSISVKREEMCSCGRGQIKRDTNGISLHKVFLDSYSFGRAEYGDCCQECEENYRSAAEDDL